MAAYSHCKWCKDDFREDSAHEIYGCPMLEKDKALKKRADLEDIDNQIQTHRRKIAELERKRRNRESI